ncbi:hypothetical protein [Sulfurimonas sp.]|uniref:hypothetical protein n=1 Tax=Sulfurimonas sp. TaxID=2022749 RepID=UPI003D13BB44
MKFTGEFSYEINNEIKTYDSTDITSGEIIKISEPASREDNEVFIQTYTLETDEGIIEYETTYYISVHGTTSSTELTKIPTNIEPIETFNIIEAEYDEDDK